MEAVVKSGFLSETGTRYYYRDDIQLPVYDRNGIDMVGFQGRDETDFSNIIYDSDTIDKLFDLKNKSQKELVQLWYFCTIEFMNSDFKGIGIKAPVALKDNKFWITFEGDNFYSEISQDLLEEIAGKKLPTPEELQRQWDAED